jgi:hypothetical protein
VQNMAHYASSTDHKEPFTHAVVLNSDELSSCAGPKSSTSVLRSPSRASASPVASHSPPRRPANTSFINFNLDLTSSAPFSMSPTRPEALSALQAAQPQCTAQDTLHSSRPASHRSCYSTEGAALDHTLHPTCSSFQSMKSCI